MRSIVLFLLLLLLGAVDWLEGGNMLRVNGNGFSFLITEPEDWTIDLNSAAQLAHFVACKKGTNWREADVAIFARFVKKDKNETLGAFVKSDPDQFERSCPFF